MNTTCRSCFRPLSGFSSSYHTFSVSLLEDSTHANHFNQILSLAITAGRFEEPFISSKLLYSSKPIINNITFSRTLFFQIPNPNSFAWNFMFKAYAETPFPDQSLILYNQMCRQGFIVPNNYTFPVILKSCARLSLLEKGKEIHSSCFKLGLEFDIFVQNSLISMYFLCRATHFAQKVFELLPYSIRDVVSWYALIYGYLKSNQSENALKVFAKLLPYWSLCPDKPTIISAFSLCAKAGLIELGKKLHGLVILTGCQLDVFVGSSLVELYSKCRRIEDARKVFDRLPDRTIDCWTFMIGGYTQSDLNHEALQLFMEMHGLGIIAKSKTLVCVVSACAHLGALNQVKWFQTYCQRHRIELSLVAKNAFINAYSKCGDTRNALNIFNGLIHKDVFSWSAMICGLAMNGESEQALSLFSLMETSSSRVRPNDVTFLGVLCACNNAGYVKEGLKIFKSMTQNYNITPRVEHFACMVDLLGRADLLEDAKRFVSEMPVQPNVATWGSLVFAGRNQGDTELVEFAVDQIQEMDSSYKCVMHDLAPNAYASAFLWSDAIRVRDDSSARKRCAYSSVQIDEFPHVFYVGD